MGGQTTGTKGWGTITINVPDASNSPDVLLPYFEHNAQGRGPDNQFVRAVAIIRRWQALAARDPLDGVEFNRLVQLLEVEQDPGTGWGDLWGRTIAWGVVHGLTEWRPNSWYERGRGRVEDSSKRLAGFIVDALHGGGFIVREDFARAAAIVAEEIDANKAMGDYWCSQCSLRPRPEAKH